MPRVCETATCLAMHLHQHTRGPIWNSLHDVMSGTYCYVSVGADCSTSYGYNQCVVEGTKPGELLGMFILQ